MRNNVKYTIGFTTFIITLLLLDYFVGVYFDYQIKRLPYNGERVAKSAYVINNVNSDALIFGSSKAETGYNPQILNDSIPDLSFYNCGVDGQGFYYCNTVINCVLNRYTPKMIIWDFKESDISGSNDENLSLIYPYYKNDSTVRHALNEKEDMTFRVKMRLNTYRYNATAARILRAKYLINRDIFEGKQGFGPKISNNEQLNKAQPNDFFIEEKTTINQDKEREFESTLKRLQDLEVDVYIVISPNFNKYNYKNHLSQRIGEICTRYNVHFINNADLKGFPHNNNLYYDDGHLNLNGANLFTSSLAQQIKSFRH